jgi:hypothetical protein
MKFIVRWTENGGQDKRQTDEECVYLPVPGDLYTPKDGPQLRVMSRRLGGAAIPILGGVVALSEDDL